MSDATLRTIRIEKPVTASFGGTMNEIRTWLDHRKIQPVDSRPINTTYGFGFELGFRTEDEARLFKRDFADLLTLSSDARG